MSTDRWEQLSEDLVNRLFQSPYQEKIRALEDVSLYLEDLENAASVAIPEFLTILIKYYDHFTDKKSKTLTVEILNKILDLRPEICKGFIKGIDKAITSHKSVAISDLVLLSTWIDTVILSFSKNTSSDDLLKDVIITELKVLDNVFYQSAETDVEHKQRIRSSILSGVKRSLSTLAKDQLLDCIRIINDTNVKEIDASITLTGLISEILKEFPTDAKSLVLQYYTKVVLASKVPLQNFQGLNPFIAKEITLEDLTTIIVPQLEKSILRSPELAFSLAYNLFISVNPTVDLPQLLISSKLLSQIISSFKSSKEPVRDASLRLFKVGISHSSSESTYSKVAEELIKALKSISVAEQKALISKSLSLIPPIFKEVSTKITSSLLAYVGKDQNEISLREFLNAFFTHLLALVANGWLGIPEVKTTITKGFKDSKLHLRRLWFTNFGDAFLNSTLNESLKTFTNEIIGTLIGGFDEITSSPTTNIKGISIPYVVLAIGDKLRDTVDFSSLSEKGLSNDKHPSVLINPRIYSKLSTSEERRWFIRALLAITSDVKEVNVEYGKAWVTFILSADSTTELRTYNLKQLLIASSLNQGIVGISIINGLYELLLHSKDQDNHGLLYDFTNIHTILYTILTPTTSEEITIRLLSASIIVSHHEFLPKSFSWVSLSLHSNTDPSTVTKNSYELLVTQISDILLNANVITHEGGIFKAAANAISTLAFIDPENVGPLLKELVLQDFDVSKIESISSQDVLIWKTQEGQLAVNVLDSQKETVEDKNTKDYETRKWEESLRKEVAKKNQGHKKLTKEQQALINEQLSKESETRKEVQGVHNSLHRGLAIVQALSKNSEFIDNGKKYWFATSVNKLLEVLSISTTNEIAGILPTSVFLELSNVASSKLGPLKYLLGVATLRFYEVGLLDDRFKEEKLLDLISRLLYKFKFLSDQQPFDFFTLIYSLPLITRTLEEGKKYAIENANKPATRSEFVEEVKEEEQLLLAIEIIENHAEEFKNTVIPRDRIISVLLSLLSLPTKAKLAKDSILTLSQYMSIDYTESDLRLFFEGLLSADNFVRNTVLEVLDEEFDLTGISHYSEIWIACHDNEETNADIASTIWEESGFEVTYDLLKSLYSYLGNHDGGIRLSTAKSVAHVIKLLSAEDKTMFNPILNDLMALYVEKSTPPAPVLDKFGLVVKSAYDQKDQWEIRSGIALTFENVASLFDGEEMVTFVKFLIDNKALGDQEAIVTEEFKQAALAVIDHRGGSDVESLIEVFESALSTKRSLEKTEVLRENVVVLYGSLAKHLSSNDERLTTIIARLLKTLETSSESVQKAISDVIAPLVPLFKDKAGTYIDQQFKILFNGKTMSVRRGAAYGISGIVKGYGISALSEFDIIRNLSDAADDKKDPKRRQSVSIAFQCLSSSLHKFFEPYAIEILPIILKSLGDAVPEVRESTSSATKTIMQNTTSYGVKRLIPLAIENLDDISWRSKKGSIELLGSMAYLDPTQLSASLSAIVPEIVGVLNDSHKEVRKAGDEALNKFGEVIRNPEIKTLVPILIKAIGDPTKHTEEALDELIKTQFVHYIDGPSLALIIHVIHRGMRDRSANTKRKACQIVGNMAILVDTKDLIPYLHQLISELQIAMVDPVPNTRATASRALGSLVEKLGEAQFPDLIPRLLDTLSDESKAGDRLGSAQALAEVVSGLGVRKLDDLLPTILKGAMNSHAYIREGYLPLLLFLPVCFGSQFAPYISQIIPAILNGLADTDESIRSTAVKAGRLLVKNYANKAIDLLLPELESGLLDINYRIRLSSIELTGDLLFQLTGISGKSELVEDESEFTGTVGKQLIDVLGMDRRDRVLALLFICRSDTAGVVRNAAIDIWKSLVANTPRTVKEILPTLTKIIIRRLANSDESQRTIAAHTLGELVRRVGTDAFSQLLPTLQESLETSDSDAKQGICIAICELIESSTRETIEGYKDIFVDIIRTALVDSSPIVRESAAQMFDVYQNAVGNVAIDEIVPYLLNLLQSPNSENSLKALEQIMTTKSDIIFPILIPTLLVSPMDSFRAEALGSLAHVAGKALYGSLTSVINTLISELTRDDLTEETSTSLKNAFDAIVLSVHDNQGLHPLLQQLLLLIKEGDSRKRAIVFERLGVFFQDTTLDYSVYTSDILTQCILSLDDEDPIVVKNDVVALTLLTKNQSKESLERLIKPAKQALDFTGVSGKDIYGFTLPKGAQSVLPIFLHGLMYGTSEQREVSALGIAEVISKTPSANLKPLVTVITGPLIRVIGERFSSDIKAAILFALNNLFDKIAQFLRPFIPQLQRTFVKSLSDPNSEILRLRAAKALGSLIEYQPRIDPLVGELVNGTKSADNLGVKTGMLRALLEVIQKAGEKMNNTSKNSILELVEEEILEADDKLVIAYARLVGALSCILTLDESSKFLKKKVLDVALDGDDRSKFGILVLNSFLKESPGHIFNDGLVQPIVIKLIAALNSSSSYISDNATLAVGKLLLQNDKVTSEETKCELTFPLVTDIVRQLAVNVLKPNSNSLDTRRYSLVVIRTVAREKPNLFKPHLDVLVPSVFVCVRDMIIPIKLAAEKAYLSLFSLVEDVEMDGFKAWSATVDGSIETVTGDKVQVRSINDYTKRVAMRLAKIERERIAAGGDQETLYSDRIEDESEIWAIGGVDLGADK